jgi:gliding motility-associated-like protein
LNSVQIENDINNTFANTTIAIQNITVQSGNLVANPLNNGFFTNVFLDSSHSYLNVGETAELLVQINVQDKFGITKYLNSVQISGIASNAINVSDISDDGVSIDENSNGIANEIGENDPTLIQIGVSEVWIPEGFSPNGDGKNDYFIIDGNEYYKINLEVYNRWGAVVYQSKDYQNDWNGFSNVGVHMDNLQLPDGTYFYIVKLNNGEIPIQGSITINH